jgi:hypothetical protein
MDRTGVKHARIERKTVCQVTLFGSSNLAGTGLGRAFVRGTSEGAARIK